MHESNEEAQNEDWVKTNIFLFLCECGKVFEN